MLVLIGVAPAGFVVNMNATGYEITRTRDAINNVEAYFEQHPALLKQATGADQLVPAPEAGATQPAEFHCHPSNTINALNRLKGMLTTDVESYDKLSLDQRSQMRRIMLCVSDTIDKVVKMPGVSADDQRLLKKLKSDMLSTIEYAPVWIIMAVALALGIGTMIGWRRVATTIGEKIGKKGMTYAQGMSAQMTAAVSIGLASYTGMPVSTTHVLSSSVAGTMVGVEFYSTGKLAGKDNGVDVSGFAIEGSNHADNLTMSTSGAPWGHWWNPDGNVTSWKNEAEWPDYKPTVFTEFNAEEGIMTVGQYPGKLAEGQTIKVIDALKYQDKRVAVSRILL